MACINTLTAIIELAVIYHKITDITVVVLVVITQCNIITVIVGISDIECAVLEGKAVDNGLLLARLDIALGCEGDAIKSDIRKTIGHIVGVGAVYDISIQYIIAPILVSMTGERIYTCHLHLCAFSRLEGDIAHAADIAGCIRPCAAVLRCIEIIECHGFSVETANAILGIAARTLCGATKL